MSHFESGSSSEVALRRGSVRLPGCSAKERIVRANRQLVAQHFKKLYTYSNDSREKRTCIHPGGIFEWEDNSSGITWVAVRGPYTTCVVFKRTLENVTDRLRSSYLQYNAPEITFKFFGETVVSEIEVLTKLPSEQLLTFKGCEDVDMPFAIVCVDPSKSSGHVKDDTKEAALKYLECILKKGKKKEYFYPREVKKAAIHAFQLLCNQKFKPDDIWVHFAFFLDEENLSRNDIKRLLDSINNPDPGRMPEEKRLVFPECSFAQNKDHECDVDCHQKIAFGEVSSRPQELEGAYGMHIDFFRAAYAKANPGNTSLVSVGEKCAEDWKNKFDGEYAANLREIAESFQFKDLIQMAQ